MTTDQQPPDWESLLRLIADDLRQLEAEDPGRADAFLAGLEAEFIDAFIVQLEGLWARDADRGNG